MELKENEFDLGGGYIKDRGDWKEGFKETEDGIAYNGYALNDVVHTSKAVYMSLVDDNTTNPDSDETGSWRTMLNKEKPMSFVKVNQPYIGEDGYWHVYNPATKQVEKTDYLANGGMIMPSVYQDGNDLVVDGGVGDPTDKFVIENNDFVINF